MPRNLDRRVEALFPIEDPVMQKDIINHILNVYLLDTAKAHILQADGTYIRRADLLEKDEPLFNSQLWFLNGRNPNELPRAQLEFPNGQVQRDEPTQKIAEPTAKVETAG
jgi:polyphosphate kinase